MKSSVRSVPRLVAGGIAVLVGLPVALMAGANLWLEHRYEPPLRQHAERLSANVDAYCAQEAALGADPWFHEGRTEGDAGQLLNAWLPWSHDLQKPPPPGSPLLLPEGLREGALDLKQGRWLTTTADVSRLDFDWMVRLLAYDRWDLFNGGPLSAEGRFNWVAGELPDVFLLQRWAKFRMLHGLRTGHPLEAAQQVRHLAWLSLRTDSLMGASLAVNLLDIERMARDSLASPPADWTPMPAAQTARMNALLLTGPRFSGLAAPPDVARRARACATQALRCVALTEGAFQARLLEPYAKPSFDGAYAALEQDLAAADCPTPAARQVRTRGVTALDPESGASTALPEGSWMTWVPGRWLHARIAQGAVVSTLGDLEPLSQLHEKSPPDPARQVNALTP
jgi:hypothetical protein